MDPYVELEERNANLRLAVLAAQEEKGELLARISELEASRSLLEACVEQYEEDRLKLITTARVVGLSLAGAVFVAALGVAIAELL